MHEREYDAAADSWRQQMGRLWLDNLDPQEEMLAPVGELLLDAMALQAGERLVEIGAGGGWLARRMAAEVGGDGLVVGFEIAPALLEEARRRSAHLPQLRWFLGDAATDTPPEAPFDRLVSRFGVMFFAEPLPAFRQLRTLLNSGGRLHLAVWDSPKRNPWMVRTQQVARRHLDLPRPEPLAPGPFQLSDPLFLDQLLEDAGFVAVERQQVPVAMRIGAAPALAADQATGSMLLGQRLSEQPEQVRAAVHRDLRSLYGEYAVADGVVMPGSIWLVAARAG